MKKTLKSIILATAAATLGLVMAGCAPTYKEISANRGVKPTNERVIQLVKDYIRSRFKDPDSVKDLVIYNTEASNSEWVYCWSANAKNSLGGYIGSKSYTIGVQHGRLTTGFQSGLREGLQKGRSCRGSVLYREPGLIKY